MLYSFFIIKFLNFGNLEIKSIVNLFFNVFVGFFLLDFTIFNISDVLFF